MPNKGLEIPFEVADGIAVAVMKDHLGYLEEELRLYEEEGKWMHPEDAEKSRLHLTPPLKCLIDYFGG